MCVRAFRVLYRESEREREEDPKLKLSQSPSRNLPPDKRRRKEEEALWTQQQLKRWEGKKEKKDAGC